MGRSRMKTGVLALPAVVLMMAAPASAQDPLRHTYGGAANVVTQVAAVAGSVTPVAPLAGSGGVATLSPTPPVTDDPVEAAGVDAAREVAGSGGNVKPAGSATAASGERSIGEPPAPQVKASALDSLPFTGFDALLLLMGGTVLFAVGIGVRRLSQ